MSMFAASSNIRRRRIFGFALGACIVLLAVAAFLLLRRLLPPPVPLTQPTTVSVYANRPWQNANLLIAAHQNLEITYVAGMIRDAETTIDDANGWDYVCGQADCCEPMPNERRSGLIVQIGNELFFVGNARRIVSSAGGYLRLRINDCDDGLYDNTGSLQVRIAPTSK